MIVHIHHPSGAHHALLDTPDGCPVVLVSWGPTRAPTARLVTDDEIKHVVGTWREMHARGGLEVVAVDWPKLKTVAPIEEIEA